MRDLDSALNDLQALIAKRLAIQGELAKLSGSGLTPSLEDEQRRELQDEERRYRDRCKRELTKMIDFPPRHIRHGALLEDFWRAGGYERSVFIMSKFPGGGGSKDDELNRVLTAVQSAISDAGFTPRIALSPSTYHPILWDNVELHLLGCTLGVAIVEDRYLPELNPNVAMEWGWMRAMGKPVLFLVERSFANFRADVGGLLTEQFDWDDPESTVNGAIGSWLGRFAT